MTTLTELPQWEEPYIEYFEEESQNPFDEISSPEFNLESEISDVLAEPIQQDIFSISQYAQTYTDKRNNSSNGENQQLQLASALDSALHETLAKYSVKDISIAQNIRESYDKSRQPTYVGHFTEISEFWDGWLDDIEIDEEISSDLDNNETHNSEDISGARQTQSNNNTVRNATNSTATTTTKSSSSNSNSNNNSKRMKKPLNNASSNCCTTNSSGAFHLPTTCVFTPLIIDVTSKSKSEVTSLFLKSQGKKTNKISSGSSSDECEPQKLKKQPKRNATKPKKRKLNMFSDQVDEPVVGEKKSKTQMKKEPKNLNDFQDVFKLNQVLKIKAVEQDCEDEEIDIGDITDTIPN